LLFLMEFNPQQSFYIMVIRSSSFQGPLKCANIKPFSCIIGGGGGGEDFFTRCFSRDPADERPALY
jgi:hypothetical protein